MHSDRDRERDGRERQSGSGSASNSNSGGGGGGSSVGGNTSNTSNSGGNNTSNTGNSSNSNISVSVTASSSSHHQSRKEEQQSSAPPAAAAPPPTDPAAAAAAAAAITIYSRLPPFPSPAPPIGPSLGTTSICSASSAPIPPPLGTTLPHLNLGPPPTAISSAPIGPPPIPSIPSIPSLTPSVIGPPPPPPLSLGMSLPPIISIPSLHLPPVPSSTIHSSQHTATIMSSATNTVTTSIYHQQQHQQQPLPSQQQQQQQHQQRASSTNGTTTTSSLSNAMTTHAALTPPNVSSSTLSVTNHTSRKSPPLAHGVHSVTRNKELPTTATTVGSSLPTTATMTTTTSTTTTSQPAFVRPFEDSFRSSSTKTQQRPIMNSHNHSIANQIGHHEPPLKSSSMITSQAVGSQVLQESPSTMDSKSMSSQQTLCQSIPYPSPQQYHHPHIPVSHVPSLYKPPHFSSSSSSSSSSPHQSHHSQSKLNVPIINTSSSHGGNSGGITVVSNSNGTKQNAHHVGEAHQTTTTATTTTTTTTRNDSTANCVSSEKAVSNANSFTANSQVTSCASKIANHASSYHKGSSDIAAKDGKLNACNEKIASESPIRQPQLSNQNHVAANSLQEKASVSHLPYEQQGKSLPLFHPVNYNSGEKECKPEVDYTKTQCDQNNVLSTLPFQPNFKFSISDIAQKPMDTTQLMQSIKSEEVLRTCQNVSNVLLQIPKYQEKLLNFSASNNELKTTAFFTDKCNNLTEISVKCEPAVLNVPDLSKALVKQQDVTSNEKSFLVPERPKELTSTLDLAEKRRKRKREKSTGVVNERNACSSDSEDEEETKDMDLWITKGPPAKLQYSEEKLTFLAMFGLTTLTIRNEMELCKVEKRYRLNPDPPELPLEGEPVIESVLPIPREHPDVLLHTPDFEPKVGFLRTIGLDIMPPNKRDEAEVTWQYILADRKKRKSANSVTAYCERIAKVYSKDPPALPKPPQKMRLLDRIKVKHIPERPPPLPPLVPNIVSMYYPTLPMPGENGVKQHCKTIDISESADETYEKRGDKPRWTGIEDVMFTYKEYLKDKALERKILTSETSKLVAQYNGLRTETIQVERKYCELLSMKTALESEKRMLSDKIERINALVRNLR
ncbi:hypothetical protein DMN91_002416 [Ooceraea biroi]|uniref:Genetic suppressor element-like domain-containing protein n=2 Tax=Ooceraea biroi TaxID=2015173 RepID=A0A3L8DX13_OOCBI|nr:hypothetical protein DMN91_002416 [Ooceraea biroi]